MPSQLNIPTLNDPQPLQVINPFPIASDYLNRQQNAQQYLGQSAIGLGQTYNALRLQQQQRTMQALGALSDLYQNVPAAQVPNYYPLIQQGTGVDLGALNQNQQNTQGRTPSYAPSNGAGSLPGNTMQTPQVPAQTNPQGPIAGNSQQSTAQGGDISEHILNSVNQGAPDFTGHLQNLNQLQGQMSSLQNEGPVYAAKRMQILVPQIQAEKAIMDAQTAPLQYAKSQQDLANAKQQIPFETGKASADIQQKYGAQDQKIQAGFQALQDYYKALQSVPQTQKGAGIGMLTSRFGSPAGKQAPEVVSANKARTAAISTLATALLPESARTNPAMVQEIASTLPSVGDDPKVVSAGFADMYNKLATQHQLATSGSQSAAQAFGGNIVPSQTPKMNFNTLVTSKGGNIHNQALQWARANRNDPRAKAVLAKAQASLSGQ